jgi:hypothetical protein
MKKHYSVRQCVAAYPLWKVVIAGGWGRYSDTDTGLYRTLEDAAKVADRLNESANK